MASPMGFDKAGEARLSALASETEKVEKRKATPVK